MDRTLRAATLFLIKPPFVCGCAVVCKAEKKYYEQSASSENFLKGRFLSGYRYMNFSGSSGNSVSTRTEPSSSSSEKESLITYFILILLPTAQQGNRPSSGAAGGPHPHFLLSYSRAPPCVGPIERVLSFHSSRCGQAKPSFSCTCCPVY